MSLLDMDFATLASSSGALPQEEASSATSQSSEPARPVQEVVDTNTLFPNASTSELSAVTPSHSGLTPRSRGYRTDPGVQKDDTGTTTRLTVDDISALLDDDDSESSASEYGSQGAYAVQLDLEGEEADMYSPEALSVPQPGQVSSTRTGGDKSGPPSPGPFKMMDQDDSPCEEDTADVFRNVAVTTDQLETRIRATLGQEGYGPFAVDFSQLRRWMSHLEDTVQLNEERARQLLHELAAVKAELAKAKEIRPRGRKLHAFGGSAALGKARDDALAAAVASPAHHAAAKKLQRWWRKWSEEEMQRRQEKRHKIEAASGYTEPSNIYKDLYSVVRAYKRNLDEEGRKILQRNRVMGEIVASEEQYARKLALLIQYFHAPLEQQIAKKLKAGLPGIISPEQHKQLFMNVVDLLGLHAQFLLPTAIETQNRWPGQPLLLSTIFMQIVAHLTAYSDYVSGYEQSLAVLIKLKKQNKRFAKWLAATEKYPELAGLDLSDYTIMPVQRIPRYVLLLQDLIANTPSYNIDYANLVNAVVQVKKLAEDINESLAVSQNLQKVYRIQDQLVGERVPNLLSPHRRLVRSGPVMLLTDRVHDRELYLFNDAFLLAKRTWQLGSTTKALKFEGVVRLKGCVLEDVASEGLPLGFRFYYGKDENRKFLTLLATTTEEKADWMRDVTNCIAERMAKAGGAAASAAGEPRSAGYEIKPANSVPALSGMLMKMEGSFLKTWKERWIHVTSSGLLYSYQDKADYEGDAPPLRSYVLSRFMLKDLYVADNMTRYVVHLVQKNGGSRQIILSTFSKECMETWVNGLNNFVDIKSSPTQPDLVKVQPTPLAVGPNASAPVGMLDLSAVNTEQQGPPTGGSDGVLGGARPLGRLLDGTANGEIAYKSSPRMLAPSPRGSPRTSPTTSPRTSPPSPRRALGGSPRHASPRSLAPQQRVVEKISSTGSNGSHGSNDSFGASDLGSGNSAGSNASPYGVIVAARSDSLEVLGEMQQLQQQQQHQQHQQEQRHMQEEQQLQQQQLLEHYSAQQQQNALEQQQALQRPTSPATATAPSPYGMVSVPASASRGDYGMTAAVPSGYSSPDTSFGMAPVDLAQPKASVYTAAPVLDKPPSPVEEQNVSAYATSVVAASPGGNRSAPAVQRPRQGSNPPAPRARNKRQPTQQDLTFQAKFNLPATELVDQYFTLASGAFIYLSSSDDPKLCIENLFTKGNVVIRVSKIAALHKSKPGIFGKGTGGQIELLSGKLVDLSGLLKRRECFQAIVDCGRRVGRKIRIYRDGVLESS